MSILKLKKEGIEHGIVADKAKVGEVRMDEFGNTIIVIKAPLELRDGERDLSELLLDLPGAEFELNNESGAETAENIALAFPSVLDAELVLTKR